jgi:hypothetical protein
MARHKPRDSLLAALLAGAAGHVAFADEAAGLSAMAGVAVDYLGGGPRQASR